MAKKTTSILTSLAKTALNAVTSGKKTGTAAKALPPATRAASAVVSGDNTGEKIKFEPEK